MMLRRLLILALLCAPVAAQGAEIRLAVPAGFAQDAFVESLSHSKILKAAGLSVTIKPVANDSEAMAALQKREAELGVFILDDDDRRALRMSSAETALLTRPFRFKSAEEMFAMRDSFLGVAATVDAGRTGLFPIKIWAHSITYLLSRTPVRTEADFMRLKVAAQQGGADGAVMAATGVELMEAPAATMHEADALTTRLDAETLKRAAETKGQLYLTVGWPEAGALAAAPTFWLQARAIDKNAIAAAAEQARAAADAEILAREKAFRDLPNIAFNRLDSDAQMQLAMKAGGGGDAAMSREDDLWRKAEAEVHGVAAPAPRAPAGPVRTTNPPVFFATDRNDEGGSDYKTRFGARRLDPFQYSCAFLGAPARHSGEPKLPPAPERMTTGLEACAKMIVDRTRRDGLSKILFVIHGFNIPFDGLAWRALQLASDLDYNGAIVGWSWPSEGSAFGYAYDEDSNLWSEPHLLDLVSQIAQDAPDLQLDFVAHSMGNRMLLQMLRELALAHSGIRIGAAVFAAPDVAQDVFREQMRIAKKIGGIRTLYASEYDRAILISESYHKAPRAGSGGDNILVTGGVESVDTRLGGHSYVFDEPKAIQDFSAIVNRETAAPQRGLPERAKAGVAYWVIEP
ncbi:alpha/beta hydrolase [Rhodoblastus sp.]|uniref:alpha/beta hydrolase n=1 Tax=Rhodoblastus sp. TaxID=1962975 RepID=UPI0035B37B6E